MKSISIVLAVELTTLLAVCVGCTSTKEGSVSNRDITSTRIAHRRTLDLRELFTNEHEIDRLAAKGACLVDYAGKRTEVVIGSARSLDQLILLYRGHEYDGQVKVVSRDRISQTPLETYDPSQQAHITVNPGDLVFIQATQ